MIRPQKTRFFLAMTLLIVLLIPVTATAQENQDPESAQAAIPTDELTVESVEARLKSLNEDNSLNASIRDLIKPNYESAIKELKDAALYTSERQRVKAEAETAPAKTESRKTELEALDSVEVATSKAEEALSNQTLDQLQASLDTQTTLVGTLRGDLEKANSTANQITGEVTDSNTRIPVIEADLVARTNQLASSDFAPDETSPLRTAERIRVRTEVQRLQAELEMLKQKQQTQTVREALAIANRDLLTRKLAIAEAVTKVMEDARSKLLMSEAQRLGEELQQLQEKVAAESEWADVVADTRKLARELDQIVKGQETVTFAANGVNGRLTELTNELDYITAQLGLGGDGVVITKLLLDLRNRIIQRGNNQDLTFNLPKLDEVLLAEMEVNRKRNELTELRERAATESNDDLNRLIDIRSTLLSRLGREFKTLKTGLSSIERDNQRYQAKAIEARDYVGDQLFWIKSYPSISLQSFTRIPEGLAEFGKSSHWNQSLDALRDRAGAAPWRFYGIPLIVLLLLVFRPRMIRELEAANQETRRISTDRYSLTVKALVLTVLLSAPLYLIFQYLQWTLGYYGETNRWNLGLAFAAGEASWILFLSAFLATVCRPNGLGRVQFGWPGALADLIRKWAILFAIGFVPLAVLSITSLHSGYFAGSVGRISLMLALFWMAFVFCKFFVSLRDLELESIHGFLGWSRKLWSPILILIPVVLIILAGRGYLFTSVRLAMELIRTYYIIAVGVVLFWMTHRWYSRKARKLALAEALERRKARLAAAEHEGARTEAEQTVSASPEEDLDLDSISGQTRDVLRMAFSLAVIVSVAWLWSETIPVFSALENVILPGGLTFLSLGQAVLIGVVSWVAIHNLPGLLELSILRTTSIETGTRYAISRICQYLLAAIGIAMVFNVLSIDWSKLGWIAAALSVGLGFGLQEVVANFVCGLILLFERPVRVGDVVTIDNTTGTVTRIQMRATTITNWERQEFVVPNKNLITGTILNWTLSSTVSRIVLPIGVAYGTDTTLARQILLDIATAHPLVLDDPEPLTTFDEFADSSMIITLRCFLPNIDDRLKTITEIHTEIDHRFAEQGIEIAFPQLDVHVKNSQPGGTA